MEASGEPAAPSGDAGASGGPEAPTAPPGDATGAPPAPPSSGAARPPPAPGVDRPSGGASSFLQWLHQTYSGQWRGSLDIDTQPGEGHAPKTPRWVASITASGGVVRGPDGCSVSLPPYSATAEGRTKKAAEQAAARDVHDQLVAGGWHDPAAPPPPPRSSGAMGRATKYVTDSLPANKANPLAFLDIAIDGAPVGRVVVELFRYKCGTTLQPHAPLAVDNFLALCHGVELGGRRLGYAGTPVTRVMHRLLLQAGDVANRDGTGGAHIHAQHGDHFPDEGLDDRNYRFRHPFMLACANLGLEDSNSSQFLLTLAPAAALDGQHTCFGKVLAGYGAVKEIEALVAPSSGASPRSPSDGPPVPVVIAAAGELPPGTDLSTLPLVSGAGWPLWPEDQGPPPPGVREAAFRLGVSAELRAAGNAAYKQVRRAPGALDPAAPHRCAPGPHASATAVPPALPWQGDAGTALARYRQAARYLSWTSFKHRLANGDVELSKDESDALWDAELVLLGNAAAALLQLGRFRAAADAAQELLHKCPTSVKGLLRAGQAAIGLGPGEYDAAGRLLGQALDAARSQGLPTRGIVEEMHRLRGLQCGRAARARSKFASAFASGLLHVPADDAPPAAPPGDSAAAAAAAAAGLRHVVVPRGRRVVGALPPERLLHGGAPVLVEDEWGTHALTLPDDDSGSDDAGDAGDGAPSSFSRGLAARLAKLGLGPGSGAGGYGDAAAAAVALGGEWSDGDEAGGGRQQLQVQQEQQQEQERRAQQEEWQQERQHSRAPAGPDADTAVPPAANGHGPASDAGNGEPKLHGASEAAAAGVAVACGPKGKAGRLPGGGAGAGDAPRYGDGALSALPQRVSW
ncbi:Ppid [Scenedesmus sp. PABB004]|nr:Ppid [Scenedesmus sp. PABB004]